VRVRKGADMKEIVDDVVTGLAFGVLAIFGLRGVLPNIAATGQLTDLIAVGVTASIGYAIGRYASRREPSCDPKLCGIR